MIDYAKIKPGDKLKIVGAGAPGFASLGDVVEVISTNGHNRCDVKREDGGAAYFALTCGAARLGPVEGALAGKPGEAEGWRGLDDCPNDGQLIWVAGGRYSRDPEIQTADGDWWRSEAKRGSKVVPNVWMPLNAPAPPSAQGGGDGE